MTLLGLDDEVAEARPRRDRDLDRVLALLLLVGEHLVVRGEARLGLGLARARRRLDPLELARERALARRLGLLLLLEALALLLEPRGVVALPRDARAAIELEDPARDVVEEVAIVRDGDDRARELVQEVLEPRDALGVEVVRGLVEQQQVGPLEQHLAQRDAAPLAARELGDVGVGRRQAQRVHGDLERAVEIPGVRGLDGVLELALLGEQLVHLVGLDVLAEAHVDLVEALEDRLRAGHGELDVLEDVLRRIERRLLLQVADPDAVGRLRVAEEVLVDARHDAEQGRLAGAVRAEDADLRARVERQEDALQDLLVRGVDPTEVLHRVDVLVRHRGAQCSRPPPGPAPKAGWCLRSPGSAQAPHSDGVPRLRSRQRTLLGEQRSSFSLPTSKVLSARATRPARRRSGLARLLNYLRIGWHRARLGWGAGLGEQSSRPAIFFSAPASARRRRRWPASASRRWSRRRAASPAGAGRRR